MLTQKSTLKHRLHEALTMRNKKAVDLSRDLKIPKSAISQYLSGKSQNMDSGRLYSICRYLDVNEAWIMGFDVPMEREKNKLSENGELTENKKKLIDFVMSVPDEKAEKILQVMKLILQDD